MLKLSGLVYTLIEKQDLWNLDPWGIEEDSLVYF